MKRSPGNRRRRGAFRFHTPNSRTQTHCSGAGDFLERRGNRSVRCKLFGVPREDPAVRPPAAGRPVSRPCRWVSQRQAPVAVLPPPPCGHGRTVGAGKRPIGQNPPGGARVRGRRTISRRDRARRAPAERIAGPLVERSHGAPPRVPVRRLLVHGSHSIRLTN